MKSVSEPDFYIPYTIYPLMQCLFLILVCLLASLPSTAQSTVSGTVVAGDTNEPLAGASVILRNAEGKIKKYATSDADGGFSIPTPETGGCTLDVSMMGFAKQTVGLDNIQLPITIVMETAATMLKEVSVKADRIREQGDTITYNVGSFAQAQDRSIGDVLRRMPGIDVSSSGKIRYQGEDINKFYIEGSDLLGGKYGVAANGISHEDVGAVEVMENHQPMQVLSGISFSDKAAINLRLKDRAKASWTFHGNAGGGWSWQPEGGVWTGELFAMAVMPGFQNITTLKTNNIGEDLSSNTTDFFASGRHTELSRYVSVALPEVPSLGRKRTLFNRSALVSTNCLWKVNDGEVKAQVDYSFNRVMAQAANITTYFLEGADRVITENRDGQDRSQSLSAKFIYEVNKRTTFINNTLQTGIGWDEVRLGVTGSLPNSQCASLPDYYAANKFKMIRRFNGSHLVTFNSHNEWESLPQTLHVSLNGEGMRQHIGDHSFYTDESVAYAFSLRGVTMSFEGGVKGYLRSLNTELPDMPQEISGETDNVLNTDYLTLYATPKFEYWVRRVSLTLNSPVSFANYTFDKALANRSEVYFSPSLSVGWKPSGRLTLGLRGGTGRSPMNLSLIQPGYIMTDYRTFRQGVDDFYDSSSQNISANFAYRDVRRGVFANGSVLQSWSHLPYTMVQRLHGDYTVYSYAKAKSDGRLLMASGSIGKTLDFMRGSANLNGSFRRSESHLISEDRSIVSVSAGWRVGAKLNGTPLHWLSFDCSVEFSGSRLTMNGMSNPRISNMENILLLNIMPHRRWEWRVMGEHYRNGLAAGTYRDVLLIDTRLVYKLGKRLELSAVLNNILNQLSYNYKTYSSLSSFESRRWLRGREILISISLRK
ncbi:MAG: carboxypeptidase regulatory-like domain-containing protein [Muribaculaceae bacterium]|nr:carboxypeptidase regulatory-like domain-containing protein [Muribaculaceae bacterium]